MKEGRKEGSEGEREEGSEEAGRRKKRMERGTDGQKKVKRIKAEADPFRVNLGYADAVAKMAVVKTT